MAGENPGSGPAGEKPEAPGQWQDLAASGLTGLVMVVGAPDSGKSTLVRWLAAHLPCSRPGPAVLDADPGQSRLGPPTTFTLEFAHQYRRFVGSVSPSGHMLQVLSACGRLVEKARELGAETILMDTSGLVDPRKGGARLKLSKIELLRPAVLLVLQEAGELESWLQPVRISGKTRVIDLPRPGRACRREAPEREAYRQNAFRSHFRHAVRREFFWPQCAVFPDPSFYRNRLLALEDREGFVLSLGIVLSWSRSERRVSVFTPLERAQKSRVAAINLGDMALDPERFCH